MPAENLNVDILGIGPTVEAAPNTTTSATNMFETVFDESVGLERYMTQEEFTMHIPAIEKEAYTCEDTCKEKNKIADQKCRVIRQRVEAALKKAGCPTRLVALKRPGCGSSRSAPKKKKSTAKPKRG